jgi:dTDP-4-dehydrorhamnose 3,5-epimerase
VLFTPTKLEGAFVIELDRIQDDRGFFARAFCRDEFVKHHLNPNVDQCNVAVNKQRGILRGMHFQRQPHAEVKLVRCTRGAIFDVIIDLRPQSATFTKWIGVDLSEDNQKMLYIPEGFAHGYQTLTDVAEIFYQVSAPYAPAYESGVRWDDPVFNIQWPDTPNRIISPKDQGWADFVP